MQFLIAKLPYTMKPFRTSLFLFSLFFASRLHSETLHLTADKVRDLMFSKGLAVQLAQIENRSASEAIRLSKSRYDTQLSFDVIHNRDRAARISTFTGAGADTTSWNIGANRLLPTGSTVGLQFLNTRTKVIGASAFTGIPTTPTYEPIVEFSFNQQLGANFLGRLDRKEIKAAKLQVAALDYQTQHQIAHILGDAEVVFWNWVVAKQARAIAAELLVRSQNFLKITRSKQQTGIVEKTDLLGAQALVATRQAQLEDSKSLENHWETKLKELLRLPTAVKLTADFTTNHEIKLGSLKESMELALNHRGDYLAQKKLLDQREVELSISKNSVWPTINFTNTLQLNGIDAGSYGDALGDVSSTNFTTGIQIAIPIENRSARASKSQANYQKVKELITLKQLEKNIEQEVAQGKTAVQRKSAALRAQESAQNLQFKKLLSATKEYRRGRLSADLIVRYEEDLFNAKRAWLNTLLEFQGARIDWDLARITLIGASNQ